MPRRCCVPGCKSNYDTTLTNENYTSTFSFPKDEELNRKWIEAIPRANFTPSKYSAVCILHFNEADLYKPTIGIASKYPKLVPEAVPSIFINYRLNQTTKTEDSENSKSKKERKSRNETITTNKIRNFSDFLSKFEDKLDLKGLYYFKDDEKVVFFSVDSNKKTGCEFSVRICISKQLRIRIFIENEEVQEFNLILPKYPKFSLWSQIRHLLSRYKFERDLSPTTKTKRFFKKKNA